MAVAWPYANGPRHIGHVAGFGVPSDIFARYQRLRGNDVLMVSRHRRARHADHRRGRQGGRHARDLADRYNKVIGDDLHDLGLRYDLFTRTTTQNHYRVTQDLFNTLYDKGYILAQDDARRLLGHAPGAPCPTATSRAPARSAATTDARGDQCDNCGNQLDPVDLIDPRSKIDGTTPIFKRDRALLPRSAGLRRALREWIDGAGALAAERAQLLAELAQGAAAALDHPRPRLGHAHPAARVRRPRRQEDLRLVRRGDRLPLGQHRVGAQPRHPRGLEGLVAEPERPALLLHGQGQHRLPHGDLAGRCCSATARAATIGAGSARAAAALRRRVQRVPDDGGQEVLQLARDRDLRQRCARAATTPTRCATS